MLQSLVRMSNFFLKRHIAEKKFFRLFNLPDTKAGGFVNLMLKKNRHEYNLRFKIADFNSSEF